LADRAFVGGVAIDHQEPADRLALLELLPQAARRRVPRLRGEVTGKREHDHDREYQLQSGQPAHRHHLINRLNEWAQTKAISRTVPVRIAARPGKVPWAPTVMFWDSVDPEL